MAGALGVKATPFTYAAHVLAAAAAVMVLVWAIHFRGGLAFEAENKNLIFNVHPVLMLIGYIILGSEAIMIYKSFPGLNHDTAKLIHLILHAVAIVLGAVGIYCAFKNHNESGIANLYSLHSWLGLGAISLYGIQWIFGFVTFFFPGAAPDVRRRGSAVARPVRALRLHPDAGDITARLPGEADVPRERRPRQVRHGGHPSQLHGPRRRAVRGHRRRRRHRSRG